MDRGETTTPAFTFGVIADSHLEPEVPVHDGSALSEVPRNNARNRAVVHALNEAKLDFVVHLGDIVHPVPALPGYHPAARVSGSIFGALKCATHMTPGNHDVGDKAVAWMPAKTVTSEWLNLYSTFFGRPFYSFDHCGHHFILVNSPILNSGLSAEHDQEAWLTADLRKHAGKRTFMFTHYPPYLLHPAEESHYDNIDEPARSWLLSLIKQHSVEALFCGHVHNFFYNRFGCTDIYAVPSTSYVRSDYSELFRIGPGSEFGRNDIGKLGFFLVDVLRDNHRIRIRRTNGMTDPLGLSCAAKNSLTVHATESPPGAVGVHLRHPWAEVVDLPYNLQVDEFLRRRVRNDYPVHAMWELGIRRLRVPIGDLRDEVIRERMKALVSLGHEFTVFTVGAPNEEVCRLITDHGKLIGAWEVILPWSGIKSAVNPIRKLRTAASVKTFIAKLRSSAGDLGKGPYPRYFLGHGFDSQESKLIDDFMALPHARDAADGFVFHLDWSDDPWQGIPAVGRVAGAYGMQAAATISLSPATQREANQDDVAIANKVAVAVFASMAAGHIRIFLDTFTDIDRGFYVRNGLVDRRYDLRPAGKIFRNLHAALAGMPSGMSLNHCTFEDGYAFSCTNEDKIYALLFKADVNTRATPLKKSLRFFDRLDGNWHFDLLHLTSGKREMTFSPLLTKEEPTLLVGTKQS